MAYFLKKTRNNKGLYLQIYESFYEPSKKQTAHKSYKALGYEDDLIKEGIADPLRYYQAEVDKMNSERAILKEREKSQRVSDESPERFVGYFPYKALDQKLKEVSDLRYLDIVCGAHFSVTELLSQLVYARLCMPRSKHKTFHEVLPLLYEHANYSLDQLYSGLAFLGHEYKKVIEAYNFGVDTLFTRDTTKAYFDCTNFFFEIDREDGFRKNGPSKEERHSPIVGMGLLLDGECIPLAMKLYPGNESEKPQIKEVIDDMRKRTGTEGKVIRIADKGLNSADNIKDALLKGDGYIFSKSIKQLSQKERVWALQGTGFKEVKDKNGKLCYSYKEIVDEFEYKVSDETNKKKTVYLKEKRLVTFSPKLAKKQRLEIDKQVEKARRLRLSKAKRSEYGDAAKYVTFHAVDKNGEIPNNTYVACTLNRKAITKAKACAGYNMLVTSEIDAPSKEIYEVYHRLWKIEESFRVMKSELDARPVYLQKPDSIKGHFLICYISVLLLRLLQVKVLKRHFSSGELVSFVREFRVVKATKYRYINLLRSSAFIDELELLCGVPIGNYYLKKTEIDALMKTKLP